MLTDNEEIQCQPRSELAIPMTGYLGGATATNVRIGDPSFVIMVTLGVLVWFWLYLRDEQLRTLIPLRIRRA